MTFAETKVSLNDIYKYTSYKGLKGSFMDTERYEYKWAGNSNVNAAWTSEVGEQFEYMYRLFFFLLLNVKMLIFFLRIVEH